jgi:hypothetical protein
MADEKNVQPGGASEKGEPSPEGKPPEGGEPQPQPLSPELEERIKQVVAQATNTATEAARREIQSVKDKARLEVEQAQARASLAEGTLAGVERSEDLDPQTVELAKLRARDKALRQQAFVTQRQQQVTAFNQKFDEQMEQFITNMGIDANDKRLDKGADAKDYWEKQQRILASVSKIQKENQKETEEKLTQQQKDFEAKIRKDLGLDTEDTSTPVGASVDIQGLSTQEKLLRGLEQAKRKKK